MPIFAEKSTIRIISSASGFDSKINADRNKLVGTAHELARLIVQSMGDNKADIKDSFLKALNADTSAETAKKILTTLGVKFENFQEDQLDSTASSKKTEFEQITLLLRNAKSADAVQGISLGSTSHFYSGKKLYESYTGLYEGKYKCLLSAFAADEHNPKNPRKIDGFIAKAENGKFLLANGSEAPTWHDASSFYFEKPFKADLHTVSIEKNAAGTMDDNLLAAGIMHLHKANQAKKQLEDILRNLAETDRDALYKNQPDLERFVPKISFELHEKLDRRGKSKLERQDWSGTKEVIDIDLSGPNYDALKGRLLHVEKAARRCTERMQSAGADYFKKIQIQLIFSNTLSQRNNNSTTISDFGGYIQDYEAAERFAQADNQVQEFVKNGTPITLERIVELNSLLRGNDDKRRLGLRDDSYPAATSGKGSFLSGADVAKASQDMVDWYQQSKGTIPAIELADKMRQKLVSIHLFSDGNGRTADLVMNWVLQEHGLPPVFFDEKNSPSAVFASKQVQYSGSKPDVRTLVDASAALSSEFPFTDEERAELGQMRQQRSMTRIETLCAQVEGQLSKLAEILGEDPEWQKNNRELIATVSSLLQQRETAAAHKHPIESSGEGYYYSPEQLKNLLASGIQGEKGLLSVKNNHGKQISGVINFEQSQGDYITIANEAGYTHLNMNEISFTEPDRATVTRVAVKDKRLTDRQIPAVFAQWIAAQEEESQIDNRLRQLIKPLLPAENQQLNQILPNLSLIELSDWTLSN